LVRAYVFITARPGTSKRLLSKIKTLKDISGVKLADSIFGRFDAIVMIEADTVYTLGEIVYKIIEKQPDIIHTETAIVLSED